MYGRSDSADPVHILAGVPALSRKFRDGGALSLNVVPDRNDSANADRIAASVPGNGVLHSAVAIGSRP
jgi:hypothetical protein